MAMVCVRVLKSSLALSKNKIHMLKVKEYTQTFVCKLTLTHIRLSITAYVRLAISIYKHVFTWRDAGLGNRL